MKKLIVILTLSILTFSHLSHAQKKLIDIECSPLILDMGNSPFREFKGFKINVPVYFSESWSISPYIFLNRRSLNAYDTHGEFYDDIAPTVFNFIGVRANKDFNLDKPFNYRFYGGLNYQIVTDKYFGRKIASQINPNIGGSLIWKLRERMAFIVDIECIKIVNQNKDDAVWKFIEEGNFISEELGNYEFDGDDTFSLNIGVVFPIK